VVREIEAILYAETGPLAYEVIATDRENQLAARVREINAHDLCPRLVVTHSKGVHASILGSAGAEQI
jgi:hypothetical protein